MSDNERVLTDVKCVFLGHTSEVTIEADGRVRGVYHVVPGDGMCTFFGREDLEKRLQCTDDAPARTAISSSICQRGDVTYANGMKLTKSSVERGNQRVEFLPNGDMKVTAAGERRIQIGSRLFDDEGNCVGEARPAPDLTELDLRIDFSKCKIDQIVIGVDSRLDLACANAIGQSLKVTTSGSAQLRLCKGTFPSLTATLCGNSRIVGNTITPHECVFEHASISANDLAPLIQWRGSKWMRISSASCKTTSSFKRICLKIEISGFTCVRLVRGVRVRAHCRAAA